MRWWRGWQRLRRSIGEGMLVWCSCGGEVGVVMVFTLRSGADYLD